jgi:hypothetical protein
MFVCIYLCIYLHKSKYILVQKSVVPCKQNVYGILIPLFARSSSPPPSSLHSFFFSFFFFLSCSVVLSQVTKRGRPNRMLGVLTVVATAEKAQATAASIGALTCHRDETACPRFPAQTAIDLGTSIGKIASCH